MNYTKSKYNPEGTHSTKSFKHANELNSVVSSNKVNYVENPENKGKKL